ncbi:beta-lactamase-like protein, partial [Gorgonomyces haynaldii]
MDHRRLGNNLFHEQKYDKAIEQYNRAIQEETDQMKLSLLVSNKSLCHYHLGEYKKAIEMSEQVMMMRPEWVKGYFRKAEALYRLERYEEALDMYKQTLTIECNDHLQFKLFRCQEKVKDRDSGLFIHQLSLQDQLGSKSILTPLNNILFEYGRQMRNWIYCIEFNKKCILIDPCWDIDGILDFIKKRKLQLVGVLLTHFHVDHCGGIPPPPYDKYWVRVPGISKLRSKTNCTFYCHKLELDYILKQNPEMRAKDFELFEDGQHMMLDTMPVHFLHTPGHTPGSTCFLIEKRLFSGDTLFHKSCGRTDFEESSHKHMEVSLQRLAKMDGSIIVYPGHDYGGEETSIQMEREYGVLRRYS